MSFLCACACVCRHEWGKPFLSVLCVRCNGRHKGDLTECRSRRRRRHPERSMRLNERIDCRKDAAAAAAGKVVQSAGFFLVFSQPTRSMIHCPQRGDVNGVRKSWRIPDGKLVVYVRGSRVRSPGIVRLCCLCRIMNENRLNECAQTMRSVFCVQ